MSKIIKGGNILVKLFILFAIVSFTLFGCFLEETKTSNSITEENVEKKPHANIITIDLKLKESEEKAIFEKAVSNSTIEPGVVIWQQNHSINLPVTKKLIFFGL